MNDQQLTQTFRAIGKPLEPWESPDGTRVLVLPYGGRILGLFAPGQSENFLWTHAALTDVESAHRFYRGEQWHNSGGDRTWLAPEVDFFFPDYPNLDRYLQPRELDPGRYQIVSNDGTLTLKNRATLTLSRQKRAIHVTITKSLAAAANPLRHDTGNAGVVQYAGYTLRCTLRLDPPNDDVAVVGLWNLLQMPHGGDMLVPTFTRAEPKMYMGTVASEDLIISDHLVRYKMRAPGEHKLAIRAIATTGRVGYLYNAGNQRALVVRNFRIDLSGDYVDVPWQEPNNFGFAFQACSVNSSLGAFSELEYHVPAIGREPGNSLCEDESQVWAFRGSEQEMRSVARRLLSPKA